MTCSECRRCGQGPEDAANERIEESQRWSPSDFGDLVQQSRQLLNETGFCSTSFRVKFRRQNSDFDSDDLPVKFSSAAEIG